MLVSCPLNYCEKPVSLAYGRYYRFFIRMSVKLQTLSLMLLMLLILLAQSQQLSAATCTMPEDMTAMMAADGMSHGDSHMPSDPHSPVDSCCEWDNCAMSSCFTPAGLVSPLPVLTVTRFALGNPFPPLVTPFAEPSSLFRPPISA